MIVIVEEQASRTWKRGPLRRGLAVCSMRVRSTSGASNLG